MTKRGCSDLVQGSRRQQDLINWVPPLILFGTFVYISIGQNFYRRNAHKPLSTTELYFLRSRVTKYLSDWLITTSGREDVVQSFTSISHKLISATWFNPFNLKSPIISVSVDI